MIGVFDIFKIGIGPSSSHTMGPMVAAKRFVDTMNAPLMRIPGAGQPKAIKAYLHGSLAFTGKGHATDIAVFYGLMGFTPAEFDKETAETALAKLRETHKLNHPDAGELRFNPATDLIFDFDLTLPGHANGMVIEAYDANDVLAAREIYYSTGGGFVLTEAELEHPTAQDVGDLPFPFQTAEELLKISKQTGKSIADIMREDELAQRSASDLEQGLERIWSVMKNCQNRGLNAEGVLPGGLNVRRRAKAIRESLERSYGQNQFAPHIINDWISVYAMAVNEENAAGGQVVTSPTNGAAGVVPAVIRYWLDHVPGASERQVGEFLLVAAAIGSLIQRNASISGAECGCQAEVGSASAMAAAGLAYVLGGTSEQIENAAEIALEHHLGMTCDPVAGLVQVPCIERNGLGAIKAVSAASLSLRGDGTHFMPLDNCIETMRQTGRDMDTRYKETSLGGLAVNLPEC